MSKKKTNTNSFLLAVLSSYWQFLKNEMLKSFDMKTVQYNISDSAFLINYNSPQIDLPTCFISLTDFSPQNGGKIHPTTIQYNTYGSIHDTEILKNVTKDFSFYLREDLYEINFTVEISCRSQVEAVEMTNVIHSWISSDNYMQLFKFYYFIEIPNKFVNPNILNISSDEILNLQYKYDNASAKSSYFSSVEYEPLIKFSSPSIDINMLENRSFKLTYSVNCLTPHPIYLITPIFEYNSVKKYGFEYSKVVSLSPDIIPLYKDDTVATIYKIKDNSILYHLPEEIVPIIKTDSLSYITSDDSILKEGTVLNIFNNSLTFSNSQYVGNITNYNIVNNMLNGYLIATDDYGSTIKKRITMVVNEYVQTNYTTVSDYKIINNSTHGDGFDKYYKNILKKIKKLTVLNTEVNELVEYLNVTFTYVEDIITIYLNDTKLYFKYDDGLLKPLNSDLNDIIPITIDADFIQEIPPNYDNRYIKNISIHLFSDETDSIYIPLTRINNLDFKNEFTLIVKNFKSAKFIPFGSIFDETKNYVDLEIAFPQNYKISMTDSFYFILNDNLLNINFNNMLQILKVENNNLFIRVKESIYNKNLRFKNNEYLLIKIHRKT